MSVFVGLEGRRRSKDGEATHARRQEIDGIEGEGGERGGAAQVDGIDGEGRKRGKAVSAGEEDWS